MQSIKKGFAELTTQKWSTSALEIFTSPPPNTEMNTKTDDTYANDNRTTDTKTSTNNIDTLTGKNGWPDLERLVKWH